jgi:predicted DCC family thiol-disulfide oxidoreductase YuxK
MERRATVLYDEDCGVCRWSADKLRAWDRRGSLHFASLQSAETDGWLSGMDDATRYASWHVVTADGRVYSGGAAVPVVLRHLPAGVPFASVMAAMPATTERLYQVAVRNRARLGRVIGARACDVDPSRARLS